MTSSNSSTSQQQEFKWTSQVQQRQKLREYINHNICNVYGQLEGGLLQVFLHSSNADVVSKIVNSGGENSGLCDETTYWMFMELHYDPNLYNALALHNAIGSADCAMMTDILVANNDEISIGEAYNTMFGSDLVCDIGYGGGNGILMRLMTLLCTGIKDETNNVDGQKAKKEAKLLSNSAGRNSETFAEMLVVLFILENRLQLNELFAAYEDLTSDTMETALESKFDGQILDTFTAIVHYAQDPARFFAHRIYDAITKQSERRLFRLVVTCAESGMLPAVAEQFREIYGQPPGEMITAQSNARIEPFLTSLLEAEAYGK